MGHSSTEGTPPSRTKKMAKQKRKRNRRPSTSSSSSSGSSSPPRKVKSRKKMRKDMLSMILKHTRLTRQHLTPELELRLITSQSDLWTARLGDVPFERDPFWGFYWPGGQAVARYILDNGHVVKNRRVLDVGCGCGAGSIASMKMDAKSILANDIDVCALIATKINSDLNKVAIETSGYDFIGSNCAEFDTILIGDMFYDEEFANTLFSWLKTLVSNGKIVLIGDPGRHGLTERRRQSMKLLQKYKLPENSCLENRGFLETSVWKLI